VDDECTETHSCRIIGIRTPPCRNIGVRQLVSPTFSTREDLEEVSAL
jgi:hypothetical protein